MKITVDTNVLARAVLLDDPVQGEVASALLREATLIAIALPTLCELVWILRRGAKLTKDEIAETIQALLETRNVAMNRPAVEAGLGVLKAGGDFADGVIAFEGGWLGGESFVSFDKQAVNLVNQQGRAARLLA